MLRDGAHGSASSAETRIAFCHLTPEGREQLFTMRPDGTDVRQLTGDEGQGENASPCWSPDGSRLCFASRRDGHSSLYLVNADGSGEERLTTDDGVDDDFPDWSPDGKTIAFSRGNKVGADLVYLLDLPSRTQRKLTDHGLLDSSPSWSPDGRWIVFRRAFGYPPGLYVIAAEGGEVRFLTPGFHPTWSPRGDCIAHSHGGVLWLSRVDETGKPVAPAEPLTWDNRATFGCSSWSPDGSALVFGAEIAEAGGPRERLMIVDASGGEPREVGEGSQPAWSPLLPQA